MSLHIRGYHLPSRVCQADDERYDNIHAGANAAQVVARVDLTDECGGPRCARLRPPALTLEPVAD